MSAPTDLKLDRRRRLKQEKFVFHRIIETAVTYGVDRNAVSYAEQNKSNMNYGIKLRYVRVETESGFVREQLQNTGDRLLLRTSEVSVLVFLVDIIISRFSSYVFSVHLFIYLNLLY